jgi:hypothetical protein
LDGELLRLPLWRGLDVGPADGPERFVAVQATKSEDEDQREEAATRRGIFVVGNWLGSVER